MENNSNKIKELILSTLKADDRLWNKNKTELNQTLLLDFVEKIDETVIGLLLQDQVLKNKFFMKIKDSSVFKTNEFRFFMEENKIDNSYTAYKNSIGLTAGKRFLKETNDVVLDFPYKDSVLEGGQSTEEGTDTYFELKGETYKNKLDENGEIIKIGRNNAKEIDIPAHYEQKSAKRKEIFFNSVLAHDEIDRLFDPKALTNWKRYTKEGEQKVNEIKRNENGTIKENLIIKGNNLLALHTLNKEFAGKIKLIYIDPPYNTGNDDFKYNDNFNHSTWLTFMKNRLEVAKELLRDDGVIFVQCDDNEQAYLRVLMDEIFKGCFVKTIHVQMSIVQGEKVRASKQGNIVKNGEYLHVYSKNGNKKIGIKPLYEPSLYDTHYSIYIDKKNNEISLVEFCLENAKIAKLLELAGLIKKNKLTNNNLARAYNEIPIFRDFIHENAKNIVRTDRMIEINKDKLEKNLKAKKTYVYNHNGRDYLYGIDSNGNIKQRFRLSDKVRECDDYYSTFQISTMRGDWWAGFHIDMGNINKESEKNLDNGQKPERLIQNIIKFTTQPNDIVLDYHLGSGTTCGVAHKMGRQYIGVEQMNYVETITVERMQNILNGAQSGISTNVNWQGGGDFIYFELAKWNETAKEKIMNCDSLEELIKLFDEMYEKYFLNYNLKIKEFKEKVIKEKEFKNLFLEEQKKIFVAMLDNNQMYVNKTEMADKKFGISKEDQNLTSQFYNSEK